VPKRLIKRYTIDHQTIRNHKHLRVFGELLHDPNLWHMNRRSVSGAFAIGLFWAFIPMPFQMIAAAATAIPARVNLPISVTLVWISNPLTMPAMFYFNYLVGTWILGTHPESDGFHMNIASITHSMSVIWPPLYLGSFVMASIAGLLGYGVIRGLWRLQVANQWQRRCSKRRSPGKSTGIIK